MAFSPQEQQILDYAKQNGKTALETKAAIAQFRSQAPTQSQPEQAQKPGLFSSQGTIGKAANAVTDFLGGDKVAKTFGAEIAKFRTDDPQLKQIISQNQPTTKETAGSGLKLGSSFVGGGVAANLGLKTLGKAAAYGAGAGYMYDIGQNLEDGKDIPEALVPGAGAPIGAVAGVAGPVGGKAIGKAAGAAGRAISDSGKFITQSPVVKGGLQTAVEFSERVPRFVSRRNIELKDAATRAERIASSPAPVGNAIKVGVDERIVNTIEQADPATRKGYSEIVRLAEESNATDGTIKLKARPEVVAGEAASEQYKLIDQQRQTIGEQIGEQVKALSRDTNVPMAPARGELNDALSDIGVVMTDKGDGTAVLNFGKTGFSKAQRTKINELYELATEGGDSLTPSEIHAKDRLFSQLQRETRMDGIGDIIVDTPEGPLSLFRVFRDVYSDTLEQVAPEIRPLNMQYRNLSTFTEDIEKTIVKGGKYETNSNLDASEFAQTNLRRLFSEASSAADYRAIADEMDAASRALGYEGATPSELAQFAYEIRKIYPETTPRTGFEGSIRSVGDVLLNATKAGAPDTVDQQKALRELVSYYETAQTTGI